jgi:hypothetical protein
MKGHWTKEPPTDPRSWEFRCKACGLQWKTCSDWWVECTGCKSSNIQKRFLHGATMDWWPHPNERVELPPLPKERE